MASEKRERQKANRQQKLAELEKTEKRDRVRQYSYMAAIVAVVVVGGLALFALTGGDDTTEAANGDQDAGTLEEALAEQQAAEEAAADEAQSDTAEAVTPLSCPAEDGSAPQTLQFPAPPPSCIDPAATYVATFDTNLGTITAELDAAKAPNTVNNFVYLARYHYYDGTNFHRIIEDFMIQGGDPTGEPPGTGGPGYTISEEQPQAGDYQIGSLAMAKRGTANSTGAQFFIVTGPAGESLPPEYSLFGQVTEGLDVVKAIETLPTNESDFPTEDIIVESITITEA